MEVSIFKRVRESKGISLRELVARLKTDYNFETNVSTIYRLESGSIPKNKEDLIKVLVKALDIRKEDVIVSSVANDIRLTVGFPYAVWAAPLVLKAFKDFKSGVNQFSYTCYGTKNGSIRSFQQTNLDSVLKFDYRQFSNEIKTEDRTIYTFTAKHLIEFMEQDELDVICIAGGLISKRPDDKDYTILNTILDTKGEGCRMLMYGDESFEKEPYNKESLEVFLESVHNSNKRRIDTFLETKSRSCTLNKTYEKLLILKAKSLLDDLEFQGHEHPEDVSTEIESLISTIHENCNVLVGLLKKKTSNNYLPNLLKDVFRTFMIYAENTIAQKHYDEFLDEEKVSLWLQRKHICLAEPEKWKIIIEELMFPFNDSKGERIFECQMNIAFLGWEPKLTHIQHVFRSLNHMKFPVTENFNLAQYKDKYSKDVSLVFELLCKNKRFGEYPDSIFEFVSDLDEQIIILNNEIENVYVDWVRYEKEKEKIRNNMSQIRDNQNPDVLNKIKALKNQFHDTLEISTHIRRLSAFYDLSLVECFLAIKDFEFKLTYNTYFVQKYRELKL